MSDVSERSWEPKELVITTESLIIRLLETSRTAFSTPLDEVKSMRVDDIRAAMVRHYLNEEAGEVPAAVHIDNLRDYGEYLGAVLLSLSVDLNDEDWPYSSVTFDLVAQNAVCMNFCLYDTGVRAEDVARSIVLDPLQKNDCLPISIIFVGPDGPNTLPYWSVVSVPPAEMSVEASFSLRNLLAFMIEFPPQDLEGGQRSPRLDWSETRRLLRAGQLSYLIGQEECSWLEVKSRGYEAGPAGEIELAQDVARFANGDEPGLLVLGFREDLKGGRRVISKFSPLLVKSGIGAIYHKTVDRRVYPPVRGLQVDEYPSGTGRIIVITVPAQEELDKPFLVWGAMVDGKCEGAFISIVRRRGEHSIPITPSEIHAALSVGRSHLRTKVSGEANDGGIGQSPNG